MGKVVKLDQAQGRATQSARRRARAARRRASQDRARARRRRLHRRRLRDRRAARARPAVGQPHGQPVRRLRRHQRRLVRRRAGRQRHHARGDDARRQPAGADAVPRHRRRHAAAARTSCEFARTGALLPLALASSPATSPAQLGSDLGDGRRRSGSPRRCRRASTRARASSTTCAPCSRTPTAPTTSALLENELYLAATDLDTCERIVFGADGWDDVPISTRRARLDRAADGLQAGPGQGPRAGRRRHRLDDQPRHRRRGGREVRRRRQPARPLRQRLHEARSRRCSARACATSATWASRRSATRRSSCSPTSACTRWRASWEERYPGVDIVLIEPEPDDELMFQTSIMNFTERVEIARHGFESVTLKLAEDYDHLPRDLRAPRHRDLGHARAQGRQALRAPRRSSTRAWREILEQTTGTLLRQSASESDDGRGRRGRRRRPRASACVERELERPQEAVRRGLSWIATRTCRASPSGPPGATMTPLAPEARGQLAAVDRRRAQPQDVGLARARPRPGARAAPRAGARARRRPRRVRRSIAPAAVAQRLERAGLGELVEPERRARARSSSGSAPGPPSA